METSRDQSETFTDGLSARGKSRAKTLHRIYKGVVSYTAKQGYRADLRQEAVARASAIRQSQKPVKEIPEKKPRGAKARKAAEGES